jgi:stage II sporulation protein D
MVINHIDLEDYIQGILYHEASHYWPYDALKVQAIVCRTFALYQMQENALKDYDVTSDKYSQVYGGRTSERYRTTKAIEETKGEILTYQNKVFPTYYHATCAGYTEDASFLWNTDVAPLRGVLCLFCKESPHFKWHYVLSLDDIKDKLIKAGYTVKKIRNIEILGRDRSGRIINLKITTDNRDITIMAKDLRNILGPNIIRSTNFNLRIVDRDAVFEGFGWGHGVGLCQWGAYFMAKRGYNYKRILEYYYPQAVILKPNPK